ncbi:alpha/beta fold hydrolase [Tepidamorphus sp. 3E244]|uniref:alpha/beta fold hydrolase n=1 Tax=Tepidamorphus sp. 3E244 TaxID=3385498 RepID=UPI0038FCC1F2
MGFTSDIKTVSGVDIGLYRGGEGTPALFLHGANGVAGWSPLFEKLAVHHDLLVPEHPWFGRSQCPEHIGSVADLALFYLDLLDELHLRDVHLIGTSLGGWIAAELAVRNTSRLSRVTLVAPAGVLPAGAPVRDLFSWSREELTRKLFANQGIAEKLLSVEPSHAQADTDLKNRVATCRYAMGPRFANPGLKDWLHRIDVPLDIVWGKEDGIVPASAANIWKDAVPGARVSFIENCGHLPHAEKAEETARLLTAG